jgi:hypothetical protein
MTDQFVKLFLYFAALFFNPVSLVGRDARVV